MIYEMYEKVILLGVNKNLPPEVKTKITNINRFILFVSIIGIINFFYDLTKKLFFYSIIDLITSFTFLFFLFLTYIGYYKVVANCLMLFLNSVIFILASIGGRETIFFLYFFPVIILNFFLFEIKEKKLLAFYILLPICLLLITIQTNYSLFSDATLTSREIQYIFWANLVNLALFTFYGLFNIINLNSKIETSLLKEKANLDAIFNNSLLYIILLDKTAKVKAFNKLAKDLLYKIHSHEIKIGDDILNFIPEGDRNKFLLNFKNASEGNVIKAERKIKFPKSTEWYEIHFCPTFDENNLIDGVLFSTIEITEYKKSEFRIKLERNKAEAANTAKSVFLSTMSHEIRMPMNAIIGLSGILLDNNPRKDQIENLKILKNSAENLLIIINDILDFNRIDSGKLEFDEVEFSLKHLVETISNFFSHLIYEKPIHFVTIYDDKIPLTLLGDSIRLSQIITNLISNAIKFTYNGKVILEVQLEEIESDYIFVGFSITDTGIGISEDKIDYIFESFTQSSEVYRKFGGTGLGLAITKRLLEFQNSTIFVESELGKGSKFYFSIKFKYIKNNSLITSLAYEKKSQLDNNPLEGIQLLLVEDYAINQLVVSEFLSKWKIEIDFAENGIKALEKFNTKNYDVILMDLQMPEMDGYETTRRIRILEKSKNKRIPIIALTASAIPEIRNKIADAGMDDSISKPFNPDELFNKILKYTENKISTNRKLPR